MRWITVAIVVAVIGVWAAPSAHACLHGSASAVESTSFELGQKGQQGLVIHRGDREELVLAVDYSSSEALDRLAWIVPVPSKPDAYDAASAKLFDELAAWASVKRVVAPAKARGVRGLDGAETSSAQQVPLQLLEPAAAGPYAIQPIVARGQAGVDALIGWMVDNGIAPLKPEQLGYYVERGWTFLAIRIDPEKGKQALGKEGGLPPLRISFRSERAVYPLKLSGHQGLFPVRLYLVSDRQLDDEAFADANKRGFEVASAPGVGYLPSAGGSSGILTSKVGGFSVDSAPAELRSMLEKAGMKGQLYLRTLYAQSFGAFVGDPDKWDEDLAIPSLPQGAKLSVAPLDELAPKPTATPTVPAPAAPLPAGDPASSQTSTPPTSTRQAERCGCHQPGSPTPRPQGWWLAAVLAFVYRRRAR